jgi:hypothetical protein
MAAPEACRNIPWLYKCVGPSCRQYHYTPQLEQHSVITTQNVSPFHDVTTEFDLHATCSHRFDNQPSVGTPLLVASWNALYYAAHGSVQSSHITENFVVCQSPSHLSRFSGVYLSSGSDQLLLRSNHYSWWQKQSQFPKRRLHKLSMMGNIQKGPVFTATYRQNHVHSEYKHAVRHSVVTLQTQNSRSAAASLHELPNI